MVQEKLVSIGIPCDLEDGCPVVFNRKCFDRGEGMRAWIKPTNLLEQWTEDLDFEEKHPGVLAKIQDVLEGTSNALTTTEQAALAAAVPNEIPAEVRRLVFNMELAWVRYQVEKRPLYLAAPIAEIDKAPPEIQEWFK